VNRYGEKIDNREYNYDDIDTVFIAVENWIDLVELPENHLTIILAKIPDNTPKYSDIFLTSNFNGWQTYDNNYKFQLNDKGQYFITVSSKERNLSFKITRGEWRTEAADKYGNKLYNRDVVLKGYDTLYLSIENWHDLVGEN
jgi:hypothetical protein